MGGRGVVLALLLSASAAAGQSGIAVTDVGGANALSTVSQRHLVRVAPTGRQPSYLLAVQRDTQASPDPEGLHWYRSDDEGKSWSYYRAILTDGIPGTELHFTADALVIGEDVATVLSFDTTNTNFTADSNDPKRKVYFQWWRHDGNGGWAPEPMKTVGVPASGQGFHRATLARDSVGRIWVQAWLRGTCPPSAGVNCKDTLKNWVSTDGGATFTEHPDIVTLPLLGGGRVISLGTRMMTLWGDYSWDGPAQYSIREDGDPIGEWKGPFNAFSDGDSIYHGAALNAVADGTGGLHLVYKDRREKLYYRFFDGTKFGARVFVDGASGADWAIQPAVTLHRGELYVCTNHPTVANSKHEMRSFKLSDGFSSYETLDVTSSLKGYPTAPASLSDDAPAIPCAYSTGDTPAKLRVGLRTVTPAQTQPDFALTLAPNTAAGAAVITVTVTPLGGFAGSVSLGVSGVPFGANASLSSSSMQVGPQSATVTLALDPGTATAGTYALTVSGTSGALQRSGAVSWTVLGGTGGGGGNPKLETLTDPFSGPSIDGAKWSVATLSGGGNASAGGGVLTLGPLPNSGTSGAYVTSRGRFTFADSGVIVKVPSVVNGSSTSCRLRVHKPMPDGWKDDAGFWFESGYLSAFVTKAGAVTEVASVPWSATGHAWWRIRSSAGMIFWETSADGTSWQPFASKAQTSVAFSFAEVQLSFEARAFGSGAANPGTAKFTQLNAAPGGTDAGVADAGVADAGVADAGVADAGVADAGVADAGVADAGVADAGVADAGVADAGMPASYSTIPLIDPFTGPSVDPTKWAVTKDTANSTATAANGRLSLKLEPSNSSAGIHLTSKSSFAFTNTAMHVKVPTVTLSTANANVRFVISPGFNEWHSDAGFWFERGKLYLFHETNGAGEDVAVLTYSATTHAWWRLRETGGTMFWETSADGLTWVVRASRPSSAIKFSLTQVNVRMQAKAFSPASSNPGTASFEKLNASP